MESTASEISVEKIERNDELADIDLSEAELSGVDFSETVLTDIDFSGANLENANFQDAEFRRLDFSDANLRDANLSGVKAETNLFTDARLGSADLSDAFLVESDFSGANLMRANLEGANLDNANLSEAYLGGVTMSDVILYRADITDADLVHADLSRAELESANLRDSSIKGANLSDTNLASANLIGVDIRETDFSGARVSRGTEFGDLAHFETESKTAGVWDEIARAFHELKILYSNNGLIGKAREYHIEERKARAEEAKSSGDLNGLLGYVKSHFSRLVTGYGVQVSKIGLVILLLMSLSTVVYYRAGIPNPVYYSVVTFTTSPPSPPSGGTLTKIVAIAETFLGTLLIVLMGYILGNREQF